VSHGVRRLLQLPEILGESGHGGGRIEYDLRPVQAQDAGALWEVAIVADVDADPGVARLEHRIAEVARREVELLPEARVAVGNMVLAVLAQVAAVGVDDGGGVV